MSRISKNSYCGIMEVCNSDTHSKIFEIKAKQNEKQEAMWVLKIEGSDGWKPGFKTKELSTIDLNALIDSDISDKTLLLLLLKDNK